MMPAGPIVATMLWQSPWLLPVAMATLGLALAAVMLLYPGQLRDVPRGWRWAPPLLRAMALVALIVSMLQPAVLRPRTAAQQGAIVVLVDRSRSMSVSDRGRSPAELIALAGGLGTLPPTARKESAPGLRAQLEVVRARIDQVERNRGEADYARLSGRGLPAAEARLADASEGLRQAMAEVIVPAGVEGSDFPERVRLVKQPIPAFNDTATRALRSRLDAAVRALASDQARSDEKLFEEDQAVRTACIRTGRMTRQALAELALMQAERGLFFNLPAGAPFIAYTFAQDVSLLPLPPREQLQMPPESAQSDVTGSVKQVLRTLSGRDVQAVVLLSDGRQVGGEQPPNADLSALRAPVFAVSLAPPGQRRDVAITRLDVPPSIRANQPMTVRVQLHTPVVKAGETIDVLVETEEIRRVQRITIGDDPIASAEFDVTFSRPGPASLTVTALPLAGEISDANNRAQRWVKVGGEPLRVTLIAAADAGRQYSALHEVLSRAPWVTLREVEEADTYRLGATTLASQDLIILCDLPGDALWPEQWSALDRMVRQRGGTVIITAGAHLPGGAYTSATPAADWLPFDVYEKPAWQTWPGGTAQFRVAPARADDPQLVAAWQQLPGLSRFVALPKLRSGVTALLTERSNNAPIITEAPRGAGRVIFIGTDETWRWHGVGADGAMRFWPELLRHAAPEPYAAIAGDVQLDVSTIAPQPNQSFTLRARLTNIGTSVHEDPAVNVQIFKDERRHRSIALRAIGGGRYESTSDGLESGDYLLQVQPPQDPEEGIQADPALLPLHVEQNIDAELADLSGDDRLLRRMADSSGGRFVPIDQLPTLPRLLAENQAKQTQLVEYTLWDSPWLFGFVLACLSTEWALRKKLGLA